jgi:hypothetical protein
MGLELFWKVQRRDNTPISARNRNLTPLFSLLSIPTELPLRYYAVNLSMKQAVVHRKNVEFSHGAKQTFVDIIRTTL